MIHRTYALHAIILAAGAATACSHQPKPTASTTPNAPVDSRRATAPAAARTAADAAAPARPDDGAAGGKKELAVFFDFDSALLRDDARPVLQKAASLVRDRDRTIEVEGNCDELGTTEYNLALGEQRAIQAKDYLTKLGVPPSRIRTISFGSQRPKAAGHDEQAHAQNRRDDLIVK